MFYKISLIGENTYHLIGNEKTPYILNCKPGEYYSVIYNVFVRDGLNYYAIDSTNTPSGTISITYREDGLIEGQSYVSYDVLENNVYSFRTGAKIYSDLDVTVVLDDNEEVKLVVPLNEINQESYESTFEIDLSDYEFTSASITYTCMSNDYVSFIDRIDKNTIVGNESAMHIYNV